VAVHCNVSVASAFARTNFYLAAEYNPPIHNFNPLQTKGRLLYLQTQFAPRSKHFISVIKTNHFMMKVAQVAVCA
jgi:hypothetical protein